MKTTYYVFSVMPYYENQIHAIGIYDSIVVIKNEVKRYFVKKGYSPKEIKSIIYNLFESELFHYKDNENNDYYIQITETEINHSNF